MSDEAKHVGDRKRSGATDYHSINKKTRHCSKHQQRCDTHSRQHVTTKTLSGKELRDEFSRRLIPTRPVNLYNCAGRSRSSFSRHHDDLNCNYVHKLKHGQPMCHCTGRRDVCHGMYPGEDDIMTTSFNYSYLIKMSPDLQQDQSSVMSSNGKTYKFTGFAIASTVCLDHIASRHVTYGCHDYTITLQPQAIPNFTKDDVVMVMEYLFVQLMELYDWVKLFLKKATRWLLLLPVFTRDQHGSHDPHILPISELLRCLLSARNDRITESVAKRWTEGSLVAHSNKCPSCLRADKLRWSNSGGMSKSYLMHTAVRTIRGDGSSSSHDDRSKDRRQQITVWLPLAGWEQTGLHSDIVQHSLMLPLVMHHVRLHHSLTKLVNHINCDFKDISLLEMALTHSSYLFSSTHNEDHMINTASNCGPLCSLIPTNFTNQQHTSWRRGYIGVLQALSSDEQKSLENSDRHKNNERLEFLGDAVVEYLVSIHLFHLFPRLSPGSLATYRKVLVENRHLALCAQRSSLDKYLLVGHQTCAPSDMQHLAADSIEALIGAVYIEQGMVGCQQLLARLLFWDDEDLCKIWLNYSAHLAQQEHPNGDRHLLETTTILQSFVQLEDAIGVQFTHIRLLARSLTHQLAGYIYLTGGNYQRMEFLGDACLQLLASHFIYDGFPGHNEGHLTLIRSALVNNKLLATVTKDLGLHRYLYCGDNPAPSMTPKLLADLTESFLAALLLDKGLQYASKFFEVCIFSKLAEALKGSQWLDNKTKLQFAVIHTCKLSGYQITTPKLRVTNIEGPAHRTKFTVGVFFRDQLIGSGCGKSITEAERTAAGNAFKSRLLIIPQEMT